MPLERQNSLRATPSLSARGCTLDELLPPTSARPGELCEPSGIALSPGLRRAARETGVPSALAVTVVIERSLIIAELAETAETMVAWLDKRATVRRQLPLAKANADYARMLVAALNGRLPALLADAPPEVVPSRLADRARGASATDLVGEALRPALTWELASVRTGRTMTEWALGEIVPACYPVPAVRQEVPAASAAR